MNRSLCKRERTLSYVEVAQDNVRGLLSMTIVLRTMETRPKYMKGDVLF